MRDYPNGGFFFIDAAPIQAAGESGLKIEGIFEDAKRAIKSGKVFMLTNFAPDEDVLVTGAMVTAGEADTISAGLPLGDGTVALVITSEDVVTVTVN